MIYVMSDLHGRYDKFMDMLNKINFNEEDTLYILGDLIDKNKDGIRIVEHCMKSKNINVIYGNHEDLCLKAINGGKEDINNWFWNGGRVTLEALDSISSVKYQNILDYFKSLPKYIEVEVNNKKFLLVHAGINPAYIKKEMKMHVVRDLIWIRDEFFYKECYKDKTIIFGHTFTKDIIIKSQEYKEAVGKLSVEKVKDIYEYKSKIWFGNGKIGIDCGVCYENEGGRLGCLRLEDFKEFYV
ncbi:MAG: metallophosphoesterase [Clostridium sp.]